MEPGLCKMVGGGEFHTGEVETKLKEKKPDKPSEFRIEYSF